MAWTPKGNIKGPKGDTGAAGNTGATGPQGPIGNTGPQGPQGVKGDTGNTGPQGPIGQAEAWWSGAGAPPSGTAPGTAIGDWWLDTTSGDVWEKTGGSTWTLRGNIRGPKGDVGPTGSQGPIGATGPQGPIGNTGPQGPTGNTGAQGLQGATGPQGATGQAEAWWSGSGAPSSGLGAIGDFYLNQTTGDVSEKTGSSTWTTRTNIKGPQGPQGPAAALPTVLFQSNVANPAGLAGATSLGKMAGMAIYFTPTRSGMVIINGNGNISVGGAGAVVWASLRYGTGTAPVNGASGGGATGGNACGTINQSYQGVAGALAAPASFCGVITGLALGVQCWIDVVLTNSGVAANVGITYPYFQIIEQ